ncbi:hypothetical protein [Alkalibacter saccharofermentans]|uniref:Uncharacterized protein n=1 Tax=Alkalibacter saccharofermentans DSM 14828 TaxID=1120975 RepID=A0A1M4WCR0_9FIRM|nr:hypothetical protein [Alkalibacter saccharofermentans]SHE78940.1 hypothetical protein SAMN02746064_01193 [Alkalibacter saccharofermentans DSM 14828]
MRQKTDYIINPFEINIDPMERLLLVNFEKDPDTVYVAFEPQVFNDDKNGKGHLVIGWRTDGKVDVYHQSSLNPDPRGYDNVGKGLVNMVEEEFSEASYEVNDFGAQVYYRFKDISDRVVIIKIKENNPKRRKPFGLLAPMGDVAENPSALPLVLLHDFYFVRKKHTEVEISIAGKEHKPDELPLPIDGAKLLYSRYSPNPLIVTLNPATDAELKPLEVKLQQKQISCGEYDFEMEWNNNQPAIKSITRNNKTYPVTLLFNKAFPDIKTLDENIILKGRFKIEGHPSTGLIVGHYTIEKKNGETKVIIIPSSGWKPCYSKFSLLFLYTVAKIFKKWPTTYEWTANIREKESGNQYMQSGWKRI